MPPAIQPHGVADDARPLTQAGIIPISTNAVFCEFQRTWNRPDAAEFAELYAGSNPNYQAVIESYRGPRRPRPAHK